MAVRWPRGGGEVAYATVPRKGTTWVASRWRWYRRCRWWERVSHSIQLFFASTPGISVFHFPRLVPGFAGFKVRLSVFNVRYSSSNFALFICENLLGASSRPCIYNGRRGYLRDFGLLNDRHFYKLRKYCCSSNRLVGLS